MNKVIVASGPVIIKRGKLLVSLDDKDNFYKIPGGTISESDKSLEETCIREVKEEINADIEILEPLHPMLIYKSSSSGEHMTIILIHYKAKLKNIKELRAVLPIKEFAWLDIQDIKRGKYNVAPNIKYLIEKGDIS